MAQRTAPLPFKPPQRYLEKRIRELAKDDERITWGDHAFDRSDERDITIQDALVVLQTGYIDGEIEAGLGLGEWKCKMTKTMKGRREIGVVLIVIKDSEIFVKTVEWEDLR